LTDFPIDRPSTCSEAVILRNRAPQKLRTLIPELLEANHLEIGDPEGEISFELVGHRRERLRLAS